MSRKRNCVINLVYITAIFYMVIKSSFYYHEVDWGPDVRAHLSYMYYEWENPGRLVPQFEKIFMLDFDIVGERAYIAGTTEDVCYLGHPPVYYKLMSACGAVRTDRQGGVYIDMRRVHVCNVLLVMTGIAMCLFWGRRCIEKMGDPISVHFLFAAVVSSLPMISYIGCNISNDNILYLDLALVLWGLQRGVEGKRNYATYFLIASGTVLSVLSKLTLGLIVILGLTLIVLYIMFREKSIKLLCCRAFFCTLPLYMLCLAYFLVLKKVYHTIQPNLELLSAESFMRSEWAMMQSGIPRTKWQSIQHFWKGFWGTWSAVYGHAFSMSRQGTIAAIPYYVFMCAFGAHIAVCIIRCCKNKAAPGELPMAGIGIGCIFAFLYQMRGKLPAYMNGGDGGYQARYYICAIAVYALCCVQPLGWAYERWKNRKRFVAALSIGAVIYGVALIYFDIFYFLFNFEAYREFL